MNSRQAGYWPRAILLVDMNAFFASVEQQDHPALRGRPVAVTNGLEGTCIITASYEARAHGIRTGMRLPEARRLCPHLIRRPARPRRYAEISSRIMRLLREEITPDIEVFSVDEAFLDLTRCQRLHGPPPVIAEKVRRLIAERIGLPCSIGVSGDKTTAKYAAKLKKPNGLTIIPPWEAAERLAEVPVTELCGIAEGIGRFLAARGVFRCGDMKRLPVSVLGQRFGPLGRRLWLMCQGRDPDPVRPRVPPPKSLGHGKVLPPETRSRRTLVVYLQHMCEKVAARLRRHRLEASQFLIALKTRDTWLGGRYRASHPTAHAPDLLALALRMLHEHWRGEGIWQVQVTALDPAPARLQPDLFEDPDEAGHRPDARLEPVMDAVNRRFGDMTLVPARLLDRSPMPDVIAPAWKPFGHRKTL
ncbi:MAG: DNA polymerase IV [Gammaproteobacteria bacterium]|nr:MAG: DNA polymerase IV [Gammaproteobacteria bacterium]